MLNKMLAIFVNPAHLIINIAIGVWIGIKKTYKQNLEFFEALN